MSASAMRILIAVILLTSLIACTTKAQPPEPQKSPEYLAAIKEGAERKAERERINLETRERMETDRLKVHNLELEDQIATEKGEPPKNRREISLLKNKVEVDEIGLRHDAEAQGSAETLSQSLIDMACAPQPK